jgi:hypothetical protein
MHCQEETELCLKGLFTGDKFPKFYKERRQPWPGNGQEFGAAIDAMKQILAQIFDSVSDAMEFFNTSLTEHMTRAELRRGIQRLKIKNLDVEHVLWDLDRPDGLTIKMFIEAFEWKQPNGMFRNDSQFLIGSARENKPRIEAAVSEALGRNPQGWDAMKYMTRFRAVKQTERAKPQYDPATLIDIIEPKDVRLLSAREKFMIKAMQPPESGSLRPLKKSESPRQWTDRLASVGWKKNPEEEDAARALKLEFERSIQLQRRGPSTKSQAFTLDLSGLSSPQFPESVTFTSRPSTRVKVITPRHKLTDGFAFSEDSENVRRLMREHETIMTGRRPILSAVTSDHTWLKQNLMLAAVQRKEEEASREKARYDLDGRCYPTNSANNSMAEGADDNERQISLDEAMKSGDRAELSAIMKRRSVELSLKSAARDPFTHASASNIAYMQVQQLSNSSLGTLISPRDDPSLMVSPSPLPDLPPSPPTHLPPSCFLALFLFPSPPPEFALIFACVFNKRLSQFTLDNRLNNRMDLC